MSEQCRHGAVEADPVRATIRCLICGASATIGEALPTPEQLARALRAILDAAEAYRLAQNGDGHPGVEHNRDLWMPMPGDMQVYETVSDCSACGGAEYGTEDDLQRAYAKARHLLGMPLRPWEEWAIEEPA